MHLHRCFVQYSVIPVRISHGALPALKPTIPYDIVSTFSRYWHFDAMLLSELLINSLMSSSITACPETTMNIYLEAECKDVDFKPNSLPCVCMNDENTPMPDAE